MHIEKGLEGPIALEDGFEGWALMESHRNVEINFCIRFHDGSSHGVEMCEVTIAMVSLFKFLSLFKNLLRKPCLLINYCWVITRTIEKKS